MQSRRIRQSPGHKTDRQTTDGLGENRPIGWSLYPDSKQLKYLFFIAQIAKNAEKSCNF